MSGLSPSDSFDEALADMIHDGVNDLRNDLAKGHFEKDETKKVRFFSLNSIRGGGGGILPMMACMGRLQPKGVSFLRLEQCEKIGILQFEVYERVGKSVFSVCKRAQNGLKMHFVVVKKLEKSPGFVIYSYLRTVVHLYFKSRDEKL